MRVLKSFVLAAMALGAAVQGASAMDGGLGFQPPPFLADPFQPGRDMPYSASCLAPPRVCPVRYMYPIRPGKPCWCRDGVFVYTGGSTQPQQPLRPVYKD